VTIKELDSRTDSLEAFTTDSRYINRELSWIEFNRRVLEEARDPLHPLLERVKFLAIFGSNLDEFFMIRVSGIREQIAAHVQKRSPDGLTPAEQLTAIRRNLLPLLEQERCLLLHDLIPQLAEQSIHLLNYDQLDAEQREFVREYFEDQVFPVLTPLAVDTGRPFPHISNLSLNLAVVIRDDREGERFARVKVPEVLPRFVALPGHLCSDPADMPPERRHCLIWLEQVIAAHLPTLFPGVTVVESYAFRVTRDADMEIEEDEAHDLLDTIEQGVRQRAFGAVVRLAVDAAMPERLCRLLLSNLKLESEAIYSIDGPMGISDLMKIYALDRPDLKDPPFYPHIPAIIRAQPDIFSAIRQGDILLHHPYDSFAPVVDFIQTAANDPNVLAIKQTLYRVGRNSPIVHALMQAREQGKQVSVLVELKARFDEENNIIWAKALERTGVHVVYGLIGLKIHAKMALVVRQESGGIRRYVHLGTGNYNAGTARLYTDMGLLSCRPELGADVSELFNVLTGYSRQDKYRHLLVAPIGMRTGLVAMIQREIEQHARQGNGHLIFKINALVDTEMADALYQASQAGVQIDLIVRGMCSLRPGLPNLSEHIRVRSIVGPYLEHSRIYYFHNGGQSEVYIGSADLMERNLDRRIETIFPIDDPALKHFIRETLLELYLRDNTRTRLLGPNGEYHRLRPVDGEDLVDSQRHLEFLADQAGSYEL
jgi:polyphosphate kinase